MKYMIAPGLRPAPGELLDLDLEKDVALIGQRLLDGACRRPVIAVVVDGPFEKLVFSIMLSKSRREMKL